MAEQKNELVMTCRSLQQAQDVIDHLFSKQLIASAEIIPLRLNIEEVKLIVENIEEDVMHIKDEIAGFFGHENFSLEVLPR